MRKDYHDRRGASNGIDNEPKANPASGVRMSRIVKAGTFNRLVEQLCTGGAKQDAGGVERAIG
jgi:hypothetical protein